MSQPSTGLVVADDPREDAPDSEVPTPHSARAWLKLPLLAVLIVGLILAPMTGIDDLTLLSMSSLFMWIALASSWNLISGFTGYIDFGHVLFFGIGAYTSAILISDHGWPFWAAAPVGGVVASLGAVMLGVPLLRLRGIAFPIAMLGAFLAVRELAVIATPITQGNFGMILPPVLDRELFYFVYLALAVFIVCLLAFVRRNQFGASLLAIREDEVGAIARGISTFRLKLLAFTVAGGLTGMVGGVWAYETGYIDPATVFRDVVLITIALMAVMGGLGTVSGPVIGAVLFVVLRDVLWAEFLDYHRLIFGVMLIFVVLFMPEGIVGTWARPERTRLGRLVLRWARRIYRRNDV